MPLPRVAAIAAACLLAACGGSKAPAPQYESAAVTRGDLKVVVEASGTIEPVATVEVKSKASGEILELTSETGDTVEAGKLLVRIDPRTPRNLVDQALMNAIAGFNIHRGCLALAHRPVAAMLDRIAAEPLSRVLVMEGVNNPDNVGGLFRTAAAFGVELVVLGPSCGDPLYRKAIRTSMAATLAVPFVTAPQWPGAIADLKTDGFTVAALTPQHDALPLRDLPAHAKLALIVGAEGDGLTEPAMAASTIRVCIPMTEAVDSLNVTTAASIAMYHCWQESRGIR